ncbi:TPA: hypothetical protein QFV62_002350 [Enterococcus faecium]
MDKNKLRYAILKLRDEKKNPFIELKGQVPEEDILEQTKFLSRVLLRSLKIKRALSELQIS